MYAWVCNGIGKKEHSNLMTILLDGYRTVQGTVFNGQLLLIPHAVRGCPKRMTHSERWTTHTRLRVGLMWSITVHSKELRRHFQSHHCVRVCTRSNMPTLNGKGLRSYTQNKCRWPRGNCWISSNCDQNTFKTTMFVKTLFNLIETTCVYHNRQKLHVT